MVKDFPMTKIEQRKSNQEQESVPKSDALRRNLFYALQYQGDQEISSNVKTFMLQVFRINVYELLDLDATFYF